MWGLGGGGVQGDVVSESFELGDQPAAVGLGVALDVPVWAEVPVGLVTFEHPIRGDQDRVRER